MSGSEVPKDPIEEIIRSASESLGDDSIEGLVKRVRDELSDIKKKLREEKGVKEEDEIRKKDPLTQAIRILEFADALRQIPNVNKYLVRSDKTIQLARRFPISLRDDRAINIEYDFIWVDASEFRNGPTGNMVDANGLRWQWDHGQKFWVEKLARMNRVDVVNIFQRQIKA